MERINRLKPLTKEMKGSLITLYNQGLTYEEIARTIGCHVNSVSRWVNRFRFEGTLETKYKNNHRPRITTPEIDDEIVNQVKLNPFITLTEVSKHFDVSHDTIRRRANENGLYHFIPAHQTKLTEFNRQRRLQFCEENYDTDWSCIIFSDEKTFKSSTDRAKHQYRPKNERYNPLYVQEVQLSGKISCGIWGFITSAGVGEICEITSHMNSAEYCSILEEVYIPSMETMFGESATDFSFMQDNARIHTSRDAMNWFAAHPEVKLFRNWPAYSPDLNPIENVWAQLVYEWPDGGFPNKSSIFREANKRWNDLRGTDYIGKLYSSMRNRIDQVIDRGGNWCSY